MKKKPETTPQDAMPADDVYTNICTLGVLAPNLDKVLDVDDIAMVIVIDKKKQKHLRISYPTKTLARREDHGHFIGDLPKVEWDSKGCGWLTECFYGGGDQPRVKKWCFMPVPNCLDEHKSDDLGPC